LIYSDLFCSFYLLHSMQLYVYGCLANSNLDHSQKRNSWYCSKENWNSWCWEQYDMCIQINAKSPFLSLFAQSATPGVLFPQGSRQVVYTASSFLFMPVTKEGKGNLTVRVRFLQHNGICTLWNCRHRYFICIPGYDISLHKYSIRSSVRCNVWVFLYTSGPSIATYIILIVCYLF